MFRKLREGCRNDSNLSWFVLVSVVTNDSRTFSRGTFVPSTVSRSLTFLGGEGDDVRASEIP